jgi:FkbM family methyltransferase
MRQIAGFWWPDDVAEKWRHSLRHVQSLDWTLQHYPSRRTAVQAGGNIGLWPRRMKEAGFHRVLSFEPDHESRACLEKNAPGVEIFSCALGAGLGMCDIKHRSLGSHNVVEGGTSVTIVTLDSFALMALDLLQFDVEGYEWHALLGAVETIKRCRPVIHIELRDFARKYGRSDKEIRHMLFDLRYKEVKALPGNDFVFAPC